MPLTRSCVILSSVMTFPLICAGAKKSLSVERRMSMTRSRSCATGAETLSCAAWMILITCQSDVMQHNHHADSSIIDTYMCRGVSVQSFMICWKITNFIEFYYCIWRTAYQPVYPHGNILCLPLLNISSNLVNYQNQHKYITKSIKSIKSSK